MTDPRRRYVSCPGDTPSQSALVRLLGTRFDTLVVSVRGAVCPAVFAAVEAANSRVREAHKATSRLIVETVAIGGNAYAVQAFGRRDTHFVVRRVGDPGLEIGLGALKPQADRVNVRVRLGAIALDALDAVAIAERLDVLLTALCTTVELAFVSSLDLACDWQGWPPRWDPMVYVRRGLPSTVWQDAGGRVTGLGIGYASPRHRGEPPRPKSALALRIDDKTQEIRDHSGKNWLVEQWSRLPGYRQGRPVYRVELRLTREFLAAPTLRLPDGSRPREGSVADTLAAAPSFWRTGLSALIRCTRPTKAKQRTRWPTVPEWEALAGAWGDAGLVGRAPAVRHPIDADAVEQRAISALQRVAAVRAKGEADADAVAMAAAAIGSRAAGEGLGIDRANREVTERGVMHSDGGYHWEGEAGQESETAAPAEEVAP